MDTYFARIQNTVTQYIATQSIVDLCLEEMRKPVVRVAKHWWEQEEIDMENLRESEEVEEAEMDSRDGAGY